MKLNNRPIRLFASFFRIIIFLFTGYAAGANSAHAAADSIGVNFGTDTLYADVTRSARPEWNPADNLNGAGIPLDSAGWPMQDAALLIWEGVKNNQGTYFVQFNGQADLEASFGYGSFSNKSYNSSTNTTTASMVVTSTAEQNFSIIFRNTKRTAASATNTGITNLKIMRPVTRGSSTSYAVGTLFTDQVKAMIQKFSVGRFLDLTQANNSTEVNWSDRVKPSVRRQGPMCWEYVVQFANITGRDAYINIPHGATDDYILKVAQLFRYGSDGTNPYTSPQSSPVYPPLDPSRKVYIEWSNETWNPFFTQFHGIELVIQAAIQSPNALFGQLNYDNLPTTGPDAQGRYLNQYVLMHRYQAKRTVDTCNIWRGVFGDTAMGDRVRVVLEWQYEDLNGTASEQLAYIHDYYNNADGLNHVTTPHSVNYFIWGGGGATYFGTNNPDATTIDGIFQAGIPESNFDVRMANTYAWAKAFGIKAVAYEGGWSVEKPGGNGFSNPDGSPQSESKYDPRAKQALLDAHRYFEEAGGDLDIFYTASGPRTYIWGMTDDIYNLNTPLYQAVDTINAAPRPATTAGYLIPANIPAGSYVKSDVPTSTDVRFVRAGWTQIYLVKAPSDGAYTLKINYDTGSASNPVKLVVNGTTISNNFDLNDQGGGWGANVDSAGIPITLKAGLNAIFFSLKSGDVGLHYFKITSGSGGGGGGGGLPTGWTNQDIGSTTPVGSTTYDTGTQTWTVKGAGDDIWSSADGFQFANTTLSGSGEVVARIATQQNTNDWAKAGVMIRDGTGPGAAFAAALVSPGNGVRFQWRSSAGSGASDVGITGISAPVWLKISRTGNIFSASYSTNGTNWTAIGGTQVIAMASSANTGLAVTSHNNGVLSQVTFTNVGVNSSAGALPQGWTAGDIGSTSPAGSAAYNSSSDTWVVQGAGNDIWSTSDSFQFASKALSGSGDVIARVTSQQNTFEWAKAGVMIRESTAANSPFVLVATTPNYGVRFQWRSSAGASAAEYGVAIPNTSAPLWVSVSRDGSNFSGYYSTNGSTWIQIGSTQSISMAATTQAGLAVSSHLNGTLSSASFTQVSVMADGFVSQDIGATGVAGNDSYNAATGQFTINASGSDIWTSPDSFRYLTAGADLTGDGEIIAHVVSQQNTDDWAKAGVMIRDGLGADAKHASVFVTPSNNLAFQYRNAVGGGSAGTGSTGSVPRWVRLTRSGSTFTGYVSANGTSWTQIGTTTISMNATVRIGLAVTSHNNSTLGQVVIDQVTINR